VDIRLTRGQNPSNAARAYGISPLDPYVEWCWTPVVGPTTVARVRRVAFDQMPALRARNLQRLPLLLRERHAAAASPRQVPACSSG
jgi:hypothetical protein